MRVLSRSQLIDSIETEWRRLWELIDELSPNELKQRILLPKSKRAESPQDVLAHLHAWHRLFLNWYEKGKKGPVDLPAPGFRWNQTPQLNELIYLEWKDISGKSVRRRLKLSYRRIRSLLDQLDEPDLITAGRFPWTGKLSLAKYVAANTASHYRWARKKILRILRRPQK